MLVSAGIFLIGICWGVIDALRKKLAATMSSTVLATSLMAGQIPLYIGWAMLSPEQYWSNGWLLVGGINIGFTILSSILFLKALSLAPLSQTIPLLSFTPVWSSLLAYVTLGEIPSALNVLGIVLIVAGTLALQSTSKRQWKKLYSGAGLYMLIVTLMWSSALTLDKLALMHTTPSLHALLTAVGSAIGLLALVAVNGNLKAGLRELNHSKATLATTVVLYSVAIALQLWVIQLALVGTVESVKRGVGMAMALVNGMLFFKEQIAANQIVGVLSMTGGVILLLS